MPSPIPISALQHYIFCPRQCALIHLEGLWAENRLTVEGRTLHRKAHGERVGPRGGGRAESRAAKPAPPGRRVRTVRGLLLCSEALGLVGQADVVEFHPAGDAHSIAPARQGEESSTGHGSESSQRRSAAPDVPFPIEYKRGKPKRHDADLVQLCAQALCLEEMLRLSAGSIDAGAIYYGATKHRMEVEFSAILRDRTLAIVAACRAMMEAGVTPRAKRERKCSRCSLVDLCLPEATGLCNRASRYMELFLQSLPS